MPCHPTKNGTSVEAKPFNCRDSCFHQKINLFKHLSVKVSIGQRGSHQSLKKLVQQHFLLHHLITHVCTLCLGCTFRRLLLKVVTKNYFGLFSSCKRSQGLNWKSLGDLFSLRCTQEMVIKTLSCWQFFEVSLILWHLLLLLSYVMS